MLMCSTSGLTTLKYNLSESVNSLLTTRYFYYEITQRTTEVRTVC